ncbi:MAG: metallopeptidase family protein [Acidimicrobiales bacterium]
MGIEVSPERFGELVADALDAIPAELGRLMENVAVVVDDHSPPRGLLGRYDGIPLTERAEYGGMAMPDRITIFRRALLAYCESEDEVCEQVRITVVHEVAHHFGFDDDRLDQLGWA